MFLTGDGTGSTGLDAGQVTLSYMDDATKGKFVNVPLSGTTAHGGEIDGYVMPDTAEVLPARGTRTVTFKLVLAGNAPNTTDTGEPLHIETDLDQFNPADGAIDNLGYAGPDDVQVRAMS